MLAYYGTQGVRIYAHARFGSAFCAPAYLAKSISKLTEIDQSELVAIPAMSPQKHEGDISYNRSAGGCCLANGHLPISGSIKARGGLLQKVTLEDDLQQKPPGCWFFSQCN